MRIALHNLPDGWRHLDFAPLRPWGEDVYIQWGSLAFTGGFFVEVFPPGTYLRGEGPTLADAESNAWTQHQRELACPAHRWSPMQPGMGERLDGYGVCLDCGRHEDGVLPVRTVCIGCGETIRLYSGMQCRGCHDACDDVELLRRDGARSVAQRSMIREVEHYQATTPKAQQAADLTASLTQILARFTEEP